MSPQKRTPEPVPRPAFARWIWERNLKWKEVGELLEMSGEAVRTACLPFSDPDRCIPRKENLERIYELTAGEITPDSFHQLAGAATSLAEAV